MKGEHSNICLKLYQDCLCNTCKHDFMCVDTARMRGADCCWDKNNVLCPIERCHDYDPDDYVPDDEEDNNA